MKFDVDLYLALLREVPWKYGVGTLVLQEEYPDGRYEDERHTL